MKKIALSIFVIFAFIIYAYFEHGSSAQAVGSGDIITVDPSKNTTDPIQVVADNQTTGGSGTSGAPLTTTAPVNTTSDTSNTTKTTKTTNTSNTTLGSTLGSDGSSNTTKPAATPTPTPTPAPAPKPAGQYVDGTYTGNAADALYGYLQVQAVISGGKLADVKFLQYPNDRRTSVYINSQALPYLRQEALAAQSANVNFISGASESSRAFIETLGNALAQAKA